jgi:hypothetical protein
MKFFKGCSSRQSPTLVDGDNAVDRPEFTWSDQPLVGDRHRMQCALNLASPKIEKSSKRRKVGCKVVVLPDIELQQERLVGMR